MRLILARHGTTFGAGVEKRHQGSKSDPSLSDEGKEQAQAFGRALRASGQRFDAVFIGPLRRHRETAEIALSGLSGVPAPVSEPALTEIDYGPWEGKTKEEILKGWPEEFTGWKKKGEWPKTFVGSFETMCESLRAWLRRLPQEGAVLAFTSQGTLRALYAVMDPEGWRRNGERGRATDANVEPGRWCEVSLGPDGAKIIAWNVIPG